MSNRIPRTASAALLAASLAAPFSAAQPSLEQVGQWGGSVQCVRMLGGLLYAGIGGRLVVLDVTDPTGPVRLAQTEQLPYVIGDFEFQGDYAYVPCGTHGLQVVDISQNTRPIWIGGTAVEGDLRDLAIEGQYIYVADYDTCLKVFDVSDYSSPQLVGGYNLPTHGISISVANNCAYVVSLATGAPGDPPNSIQIFDVSDPLNALWSGMYCSGPPLWDIEVQGGYAYAIYIDELLVLDLSVPWLPQEVSRCPTAGHIRDVHIQADRAYVSEVNLEIVDISNPYQPVWLGMFDNFVGWVDETFVSGDRAYVADWYRSLQIVDVSDPVAPEYVGEYDELNHAQMVSLCGRTVFVGGYTPGVQVLDSSEATAPTRIARCGVGRVFAAQRVGDYLYLGTGVDHLFSSFEGLQVLDVCDLQLPLSVAT